MPQGPITQTLLEKRLVRYADLVPCKTAFIDARTPGSDKKENFCIIGPGVAENPGQHVHVKIAHGFNIGGARQPKGCVNSQHSHETEEVFMVHSGEWAFRWGHDGNDGEAILRKGDVISLPVNVFRGFECLSDGENFLFAILGGDDPGFVTWAPYVFENAKDHGLVLTEKGRLIDTSIGEKVPADDAPCRPTSMKDLPQFRRMNDEEMGKCVITPAEFVFSDKTALAQKSSAVLEAPLLGPANKEEATSAGKVGIKHGFHFRVLQMNAGSSIPMHKRLEEEIVFVQEGEIRMGWNGGSITLKRGDTFSVPIGLDRGWESANGARLYVVRGSDAPQAPVWAGSGQQKRPEFAGARNTHS